jgi:hypothetical protein
LRRPAGLREAFDSNDDDGAGKDSSAVKYGLAGIRSVDRLAPEPGLLVRIAHDVDRDDVATGDLEGGGFRSAALNVRRM